jgi:UDPglucose 6-dehydrogenase
MATVHGAHPQLLRSVIEINNDQRIRTVQKVLRRLGELEGKRVTVLGATFKAGTDDVRNSPALELANLLYHEGAIVTVYDPVVGADEIVRQAPRVHVAESLRDAADGADALVVATDWPEFVEMDFRAVRRLVAGPVLVDARNCLDPRRAVAAGFTYDCVGRPRLSMPQPESAASLPETERVEPVGAGAWRR